MRSTTRGDIIGTDENAPESRHERTKDAEQLGGSGNCEESSIANLDFEGRMADGTNAEA